MTVSFSTCVATATLFLGGAWVYTALLYPLRSGWLLSIGHCDMITPACATGVVISMYVSYVAEGVHVSRVRAWRVWGISIVLAVGALIGFIMALWAHGVPIG